MHEFAILGSATKGKEPSKDSRNFAVQVPRVTISIARPRSHQDFLPWTSSNSRGPAGRPISDFLAPSQRRVGCPEVGVRAPSGPFPIPGYHSIPWIFMADLSLPGAIADSMVFRGTRNYNPDAFFFETRVQRPVYLVFFR